MDKKVEFFHMVLISFNSLETGTRCHHVKNQEDVNLVKLKSHEILISKLKKRGSKKVQTLLVYYGSHILVTRGRFKLRTFYIQCSYLTH